jgi:CheY-like chemotaxis protein
MDDSLIFISAQDLKEKSTGTDRKTQINFNNKIFVKGPDFSQSNWEKAKELCQEYSKRNRLCLLVNNESYVSIWVEKPTKLPIISENSAHSTSENGSSLESESSTPSKNKEPENKPIIACIDDSKTVQRQVKLILEQVGYQVLSITEPADSLTKLVRQKPVLILMDINMPKIDGYELCKMLRNSKFLRDIPIVMLTSKEGLINKVKAKIAGAKHYITKPFAPNELIQVIHNLALQ